MYVLKQKDNKIYSANKTPVEVGELLPQGFEIKSGVSPNSLVVTNGLKSLIDGMEVKLYEEND